MSELFVAFLSVSLSTGILAVILMLLSPLANLRYAAKWRFLVWAVLAVRLLIPVSGFLPRSESRSVSETRDPYVYDPPRSEAQNAPAAVYPRIEVELPERLSEPILPAGHAQETPRGSIKKLPELSPIEILSAVWAAGAAVCFAVHLFGFIAYKRRTLKTGRPLGEGAASEIFNELRAELGTGSRLRLILCEEAAGPMIMGYLRPVLVLPGEDYSEERLRFIIRHELIHYRRGDVWSKLLFAAAASVHWFNPAVWLLWRHADIDMELSVDEGVVGSSDFETKKAYSETLFETARQKSRTPSVLSTHFNGGTKIMKKRFLNILSKINRKNGLLILLAVVILAALAGAVIGVTFRSDPLKLANDIISEMQESRALELANEIFNHELSSEFVDGEQPYPYYTERETIDGYTDQFAAMPTPYNTKERCMEAIGRIFTETACKARESFFEPGMYCDMGEDGTLWYALGEPVRYQFLVPFESAERVSGREIVARTKFVWQDDSLSDCEITFKKEGGVWKIDSIVDGDGMITATIASPLTREDTPTEMSAEEAAALENVIKTASGEDVVYAFEPRDYDGDGSFEAFGVTGVPFESGTLWFATSEGAAAIYENEGFAVSESGEEEHVLELGNTSLYTVEQGFGTVTFSLVMGVKNGEWYEDVISGRGSDIHADGANNVTIVDASGYDGMYDENGQAVEGHTYKTYYLFYDGEGFREYAGEEITEKQFESYDGGREVLDEIKSGGAEIRSIILRWNQVVNLNYYTTYEDGRQNNLNRTYRLSGDTLEPVGEGGGVYELAFLDDIAQPAPGSEDFVGPQPSEVERLLDSDLLITRLTDFEAPQFDEKDAVEAEGMTYYRITDARFDTPEKWREFVGSVYIGDEYSRAASAFLERDGKLYCDGGSRGYDLTDRYSYTVMSRFSFNGSAGAVVRLQNEYADGSAADFVYYRLSEQPFGWRIAQKAYDYSDVAGTPSGSDPERFIGCSVEAKLRDIAKTDGGINMTARAEKMNLSFALPEDWAFDGNSAMNSDGRKVFEISPPFPIEEYDPEIFRQFPEGSDYPKSYAPVGGEFSEVTVISEEEHDPEAGAPYVFLQKSTALDKSGDIEISLYVVQSRGCGAYMRFFKPEDVGGEEFDGICVNVVRTLGITEAAEEPEGGEYKNYTAELGVSLPEPDGSGLSFSYTGERVNAEYSLPAAWQPDGANSAEIPGGGEFAIMHIFPENRCDPEDFRRVSEGAEFPQVINAGEGESADITVVQEEISAESGERIVYYCSYMTGGRDYSEYIVTADGYTFWLCFTEPEVGYEEFYSECSAVVYSLGASVVSVGELQKFTPEEVAITPEIELYDYETACFYGRLQSSVGVITDIKGELFGGEKGVWHIININDVEYYFAQPEGELDAALLSWAIVGDGYELANGLKVGMSVGEVREKFPQMQEMSASAASSSAGFDRSVYPHSLLGEDEHFAYGGKDHYWLDGFDSVMLAEVEQPGGAEEYLVLAIWEGKVAAMTFCGEG